MQPAGVQASASTWAPRSSVAGRARKGSALRQALAWADGRPILRCMPQGGFLSLGRWRGVPLRVHVLTPLGALFFTGFRFEPGAWLGFFLVILLHEMGHALLVMRYRLHVSSIDLYPYGGV